MQSVVSGIVSKIFTVNYGIKSQIFIVVVVDIVSDKSKVPMNDCNENSWKC